MLDTIDKTTELPVDTSNAAKRARIESELRQDPQRSNRAIAEIVGCDHKTVGSVRAETSPPISPDTEGPIVNVVPRGGTVKCPPPPGVIDEPEFDPFKPDAEELVIPHQPAIAVYPNTAGSVTIRQEQQDYQDEDPIITVRPENIDKLIAALRRAASDAGQ